MDEEKKIIETLDETGKIVKFELYDVISYGMKEYALLIPVESEDENQEEVVLMQLITDNEEFLFKAIEDEEEFERVSEYIESLED